MLRKKRKGKNFQGYSQDGGRRRTQDRKDEVTSPNMKKLLFFFHPRMRRRDPVRNGTYSIVCKPSDRETKGYDVDTDRGGLVIV